MANIKKILIFHIGSVGDTVVTLPALNVLRREYGRNYEFVLLTNRPKHGVVASESILLGLGFAKNVITYNFRKGIARIKDIVDLVFEIRKYKYEFVVSLLPSERKHYQNLRDKLIFALSGIKRVVGFYSLPYYTLYPQKQYGFLPPVKHEALCRIDRLRSLGIVLPSDYQLSTPFLFLAPTLRENAARLIEHQLMRASRPIIAICPGAKQASNLWGLSNFTELCKRLVHLDKYQLIFVGGPNEFADSESIIKHINHGVNFCGSLHIIDSAALLGMVRLVVGLDTGTTHLAAAQGVPCVAIYGGRDHPGRFDPIGTKQLHIVKNRVSCEGCRTSGDDRCPIPTHPCMSGISVKSVYTKVLDLLPSPV